MKLPEIVDPRFLPLIEADNERFLQAALDPMSAHSTSEGARRSYLSVLSSFRSPPDDEIVQLFSFDGGDADRNAPRWAPRLQPGQRVPR